MDSDFAPSMVIDQPEIIQLEKPTAGQTENFRLRSAHAAKPASPKQTPAYNGYIHVEKD
jgi:hypothetical protein